MRSRRKSRRINEGVVFTAIAVAVFAISLAVYSLYVFGTARTETITIVERPPLEQKLVKSAAGDWYSVEDSYLRLKFRSRDTWGNLTVGKTYEVTVYGWRSGFFSMYPNIVEERPAK